MNSTDTIREVYIDYWFEAVVFNTENIDGDEVIAQGTRSGSYYILTLGKDLTVLEADLYF